jgi:hypothetical protein
MNAFKVARASNPSSNELEDEFIEYSEFKVFL